MDKIILKSELFYGLDEATIKHILSCIDHKILNFSRDEYLYDFSEGFKAGIVLRGRIDLCTIDDGCLLYTSPSPRDRTRSRMPSSA